MTSKCVFCGEHVQSGGAFLVLSGELKSDGEFKANNVEGPAHTHHFDEIQDLKARIKELEEEMPVLDEQKFPVIFR